MSSATASPEKVRVYRLRHLPGHVDRLSAAELFAKCFDGLAPQNIHIPSLAHVIDPWTRPATKTATLTFRTTPVATGIATEDVEWKFPVPGLAKPLLLDHHFRGLTPLNEVSPVEHQYELAARLFSPIFIYADCDAIVALSFPV